MRGLAAEKPLLCRLVQVDIFCCRASGLSFFQRGFYVLRGTQGDSASSLAMYNVRVSFLTFAFFHPRRWGLAVRFCVRVVKAVLGSVPMMMVARDWGLGSGVSEPGNQGS